MTIIKRQYDDRIDELEAVMVDNYQAVNCPLVHRFSRGMYVREIFMPAGTLVTSKIHKTEHPFIVSKGEVMVSIDKGEWEHIKAPYTGITQPGTRRVLMIIEDCVWTTFHRYKTITGDENALSTEEKERIVAKIEKRIIQHHNNKLLKSKICHSLQ